MTASRVAAGLAASITALLLQAVLVGPLSMPLPISLPAVVVAAIGLRAGPASGMALGFSLGLIADLASDHRVGVLALVWLGLGLAAGVLGGLLCGTGPGNRAALRTQAAVVGMFTGIAAAASVVIFAVLALLSSDAVGPLPRALLEVLPAAVGDGVLALAVLPLVAVALRSPTLRPAPVASRVLR
ncbi:MAG: hypothetical protein ACR2KJ_06695 [Jatrophihabitans sp.]